MPVALIRNEDALFRLRVTGPTLNLAPELHSPDLFLDLLDGQPGKPFLSILRVIATPRPMQVQEANGVGNTQLSHKGLEPPISQLRKPHQRNVLAHCKTSGRFKAHVSRYTCTADLVSYHGDPLVLFQKVPAVVFQGRQRPVTGGTRKRGPSMRSPFVSEAGPEFKG